MRDTTITLLSLAVIAATIAVWLAWSATEPSHFIGQQPVPQVRDMVREVCDAIRSTGHPV